MSSHTHTVHAAGVSKTSVCVYRIIRKYNFESKLHSPKNRPQNVPGWYWRLWSKCYKRKVHDFFIYRFSYENKYFYKIAKLLKIVKLELLDVWATLMVYLEFLIHVEWTLSTTRKIFFKKTKIWKKEYFFITMKKHS